MPWQSQPPDSRSRQACLSTVITGRTLPNNVQARSGDTPMTQRRAAVADPTSHWRRGRGLIIVADCRPPPDPGLLLGAVCTLR